MCMMLKLVTERNNCYANTELRTYTSIPLCVLKCLVLRMLLLHTQLKKQN